MEGDFLGKGTVGSGRGAATLFKPGGLAGMSSGTFEKLDKCSLQLAGAGIGVYLMASDRNRGKDGSREGPASVTSPNYPMILGQRHLGPREQMWNHQWEVNPEVCLKGQGKGDPGNYGLSIKGVAEWMEEGPADGETPATAKNCSVGFAGPENLGRYP